MIFLIERFNELGWGVRALGERDFARVCGREKLEVVEYPISGAHGLYIRCCGRSVIAVDSRLRGVGRLIVLWHEVAHHFLHVPPHVTAAHFFRLRPNTKQEFEAEVFSSVALLPEPKLRRMLAAAPEEWEPGFTQEMVEFRLKVLELYGV